MVPYAQPVLAAHGTRTPGFGGGRFLDGSVTVDSRFALEHVWFVASSPDLVGTPAPAPGAPSWNSASFTGANTFHIRVANAGASATTNRHYYWVLAQDSNGGYSNAVQVRI